MAYWIMLDIGERNIQSTKKEGLTIHVNILVMKRPKGAYGSLSASTLKPIVTQ